MLVHRNPKRKYVSCFLGGFLLTLSIASSVSLDPREVTNGDYMKFVKATRHPIPEHWLDGRYAGEMENEPVVLVTWYDGVEYCRWAGERRLPTVKEWMVSCEAGELGKIGNVWEWTSTEVALEGENFIALCGPLDTCDCSHRYQPHWKNMVKGFRCVGGPMQMTSIDTPHRAALQ